ncbi:hypothetical protein [Streptomyces sp. NPDC004682]
MKHPDVLSVRQAPLECCWTWKCTHWPDLPGETAVFTTGFTVGW